MHIVLIKQFYEVTWTMAADKTTCSFFLRKNNSAANIANFISFLGQDL